MCQAMEESSLHLGSIPMCHYANCVGALNISERVSLLKGEMKVPIPVMLLNA